MTKKLDRFIEDYLASQSGEEAIAAVNSYIVRIYRAQCIEEFGERCADFDPECCVCQAWSKFDDLCVAHERH